MKTMKLGQTNLAVPVFAIGVIHINRLDGAQAEAFVQTCLENGCNFFDNADVYGSDKAQFGRCDEIFSKAVHMSPSVREKIIVQDKIGFEPPRPGECRSERLNSSKAYILQAVDNSLKRLNTDYLDVLLLHAPDALTDPAEVAEAFDALHTNGKVRHFGVSNYNTFQIQLLQKYLKQPIVADQLCLSIANSGLISEGMYVNIMTIFPCNASRVGSLSLSIPIGNLLRKSQKKVFPAIRQKLRIATRWYKSKKKRWRRRLIFYLCSSTVYQQLNSQAQGQSGKRARRSRTTPQGTRRD